MNTAQKAFTYIDLFAREIRGILCNPFFINSTSYKEKEKRNGSLERVVMESIDVGAIKIWLIGME